MSSTTFTECLLHRDVTCHGYNRVNIKHKQHSLTPLIQGLPARLWFTVSRYIYIIYIHNCQSPSLWTIMLSLYFCVSNHSLNWSPHEATWNCPYFHLNWEQSEMLGWDRTQTLMLSHSVTCGKITVDYPASLPWQNTRKLRPRMGGTSSSPQAQQRGHLCHAVPPFLPDAYSIY